MKRWTALLLALLVLPTPALSSHGDDGVPSVSSPLPNEPVVGTDINPVDDAQRDLLETLDGTLTTLDDAVGPVVQPVYDGLPKTAITLFSDGVAEDGGHGHIGSWSSTGDWGVDATSARTGARGFGYGGLDGYPVGGRAALVTPELDLRTGLGPQAALGDVEPPVVQTDGDDLAGLVDVYGEQGAATGDAPFILKYWNRHNLADGLDGVQVWLLDMAGDELADFDFDACGIDCTVLQPRVTTPQASTAQDVAINLLCTAIGLASSCATDDADDYTGTQDWELHYVDLTPWSERRVHVAFVLDADGTPPGNARFDDPGLFDHDDFYGFHLDDVALRAPAAGINLQVHEILSLRDNQELDIEAPVPVETVVRNTGSIPLVARVTVELVSSPALSNDYRVVLPDAELPPGGALPIDVTFPAIGDRRTVDAVVSVDIVDDEPDDLETGAPVDVDGDDDRTATTITTIRQRVLTMDKPQTSATWVELDEPFDIQMTVHNEGTVDLDDVTLVPYLADEDNGDADATDLLLGDPERTFDLAIGESKTVTWDVDTSDVGRYQLHVRTSEQPAFDFTPRPLPTFSTVHRSTTPLVDGSGADTAWAGTTWTPLTFEGDDVPDATAWIKSISTSEGIAFLIEVLDGSDDELDTFADDIFDLYLDDRADRVLHDGEPSFRVGPADDAALLQWSTADQDWVDHPDGEGQVAREYGELEHQGDGYTVEVLLPYGPDLAARPGDLFGIAGRIYNEVRSADGEPPTIEERFHPAPESVPERLQDWTLADIVFDPSLQPLGDKPVTSRGFGIGTGPAPLYHQDFTESCPDLDGGTDPRGAIWKASGSHEDAKFKGKVVGYDGWGCGYYAPEGTNLLYAGLHSEPGTLCGSAPCKPYSNSQFVLGDNHEQISRLSFTPDSIDADQPYLSILHQYATPVRFYDSKDVNDEEEDLFIDGIASVTAFVDGARFLLTPGIEEIRSTRHWDTEETTGVADARYGEGRDIGRDTRNGYSYCTDENALRAHIGHCGWWYPSGRTIRYLPQDEVYPIGADFTGSPWKIDRIPLFGSHWNRIDAHGEPLGPPQPLDIRGKGLELQFDFDRHYDGFVTIDPSLTPERPHGWRIAALAITEGPGGVRDASLDAAELDLPYDAEELGLGPGTSIPVQATVTNTGVTVLENVRLVVDCLDADNPSLPPIASGATILPDPLETAQTTTVSAACLLPGPDDANDATGKRVRIEARVELPGGDDLAINNGRQVDGIFDVRASPDVAVSTFINPTRGSSDQTRFIEVVLDNQGNVPLSDFDVGLRFKRGENILLDRTPWTLYPDGEGDIGVGEQLRITTQTAPFLGISLSDLRIDSQLATSSGEYTVLATASRLGDVRPTDDVGAGVFQVVSQIYADDFGGGVSLELPGLVSGGIDLDAPWSFTSVGGRRVALLGDGEIIPTETDASLTLPTMDLTSANGATLTLRHAYDLEPGYDAGRVEVSTDGGETWEPLRPTSTLSNPLGYPDITLVGSNALLAGAPEATAAAFTGDSRDDPSNEDGFVTTEFRLGDAKNLQQVKRLADFPLDELGSQPTNVFTDPADGNAYEVGENWNVGDDGWRIDNQRVNNPKPHSGQKMLWSGTPGESTTSKKDHVDTSLTLTFNLTHLENDQGAALRFWDYRSGWLDAELDGDRDGTGGLFRIHVDDGGGVQETITTTLERAPNGWTHRELDLTGFAGSVVNVTFHYQALRNQGLDVEAIKADPDLIYFLSTQENHGWFLDDLYAESFTLDLGARINATPIMPREGFESYSVQNLDADTPCDDFGSFQRSSEPREEDDKPSAGCWQIRQRGDPVSSAWHVDAVDGPSGLTTNAWTISSDSTQGYDHKLDTRLVTPSVDLRSIVGDSATLSFDHRFELEYNDALDEFSPYDGGTVEVQVFDERTGGYGPWQQLLDNPSERPVVDSMRSGGTIAGDGPDRFLEGSTEQVGYTTAFPRGIVAGLGSPNAHDDGIGTSFQPFEALCRGCRNLQTKDDFSSYPISYGFSGDSEGWQSASFDVSPFIGQKVRFAFHAWSNPSDLDETQRDDLGPLLGWEVTNVAVDGVIFDGKPLQLRFRGATDGSVLDGRWALMGVEVAANILEDNVALVTEEETLRFAAADEPSWSVDLVNLGTKPRDGLALAVRATQDGVPTTVDVLGASSVPAEDIPTLRDGEVVYGPVTLTSVGNVASNRSWSLSLPDVEAGVPVRVEARILEDNGENVVVGGEQVHVAEYTTPDDEVLANTRTTWSVTQEDSTDVSMVSQANGYDLKAEGAGAGSDGDAVIVTGTLRNDGTLDASLVDPTWLLEDMVLEETVAEEPAGDVVVSAQGGVEDVVWNVPDLSARASSLYRVTFLEAGAPLSSLEFSVGRSESLYVETFDGPTLPAGWSVSTIADPEEQPGGFNVQWRGGVVGSHLLWGVDPFKEGDYCGGRPDAFDCGQGVDEGFTSSATTQPLDLGQALNDQVSLTMDHSFWFYKNDQGRGDGGRLEVRVVDEGVGLVCDAPGVADWMPLTPTGGTTHDGIGLRTAVGGVPRANPLGDSAPLFAGPKGSTLQPTRTTYDLAEVTWCPGGSEETLLKDAEVRLRLNVGIWNGNHPSDRIGWQVDTLGITSGGVTLGPLDGDQRTIDIGRNVPKRIAYSVHNDGVSDDQYSFELSYDGVDPEWAFVEEPTLTVPGGETRLVYVYLSVPETLPVGRHDLRLGARSIHDNSTLDFLTTVLDVEPVQKADLVVAIDEESEGYQQGSVATVPIRISNAGDVASRPTVVTLTALDADDPSGTPVLVETLEVPEVCAPAECGPVRAQTVVTAEWSVPESIGDYILTATIDPVGALLEQDRFNNVASVPVQVVPLQRPDLVVVDVEAVGDGVSGRFVEDGSIITVRATILNDGPAAAQGATVRLRSGTIILTEEALPLLPPGASHTVEAIQVVQADDSGLLELSALVTGGLQPDLVEDNNKLLTVLVVRTHDVLLEAREGLAVRAGSAITVPIDVSNRGNALETLELEATGPDGWNVQVLTPTVLVSPGGTVTGLLLVQVPDDALAQRALLSVTVRAAERVVAVADAPVEVATVLEPATVTFDLGEVRSGVHALNLTLESNANVPQAVRVVDALGWLDATELQLGAGEVRTLDLELRVPNAVAPGLHHDILTVAAVDGAWEHVLPHDWEVLPTAAIETAWSTVRPMGVTGNGTRAMEFDLLVTNVGNVPVTVTSHPEAGPGTGIPRLPTLFLEPDQQETLTVLTYVDERLETPTGSLRMELDGATNATHTATLPNLLRLPDLTVAAVALDPDSGMVRGVVRNDGDAPAPASTLHAYMDGVLVAIRTVPALQPDAEEGFNLTLSAALAGDLVLLADGDRTVLERHEDNNGATLQIPTRESLLTGSVGLGAPSPTVALVALALCLALLARRRWTQ